MCSTGWHTWCDAWNRVLNRSSTNACSRNPPPCPTGALCRERKVANVSDGVRCRLPAGAGATAAVGSLPR
ncbi:hypothetical protein Y032_0375g238 [Ancylostoma ceylanicum]|uniref:Uncharacterized protein n=1 Tax=Ancylostoma ceylanicum TaxID=53326 RepID=A0A016RUQ5_9BILA|nr:hypothetical protein Y032_0375g238 [Ancylostoma ceylanicum]